jgi:hypothetical protein
MIAELKAHTERLEAELAKAQKVIEIWGNALALSEQMLGAGGASEAGTPSDDLRHRRRARRGPWHTAGATPGRPANEKPRGLRPVLESSPTERTRQPTWREGRR